MAYQTIYREWLKINLRETRRQKIPWMSVCYLRHCHDLGRLAPKWKKVALCWPENEGDLFMRRLGLWLSSVAPRVVRDAYLGSPRDAQTVNLMRG